MKTNVDCPYTNTKYPRLNNLEANSCSFYLALLPHPPKKFFLANYFWHTGKLLIDVMQKPG